MVPSRRLSNGRSPLVNQQRQITTFFSKSSSSSPITPTQNPTKFASSTNPKFKPKPARSPSPSPSTPSPLQSKLKKPLLVIGGAFPPSLSPLTPASEKLHGEEVVGKRIKVYWPLDKSWYEGFVTSFDKDSGKHLVQYDDGEEESVELAKEKIEWIEETVRKFKRLRRGGSSFSVEKMVIDDEVENLDDEDEEEDNGDDSSDEDWGKSGEKEGIEDSEEKEVVELDDEDEDNETVPLKGKRNGKRETRKRKVGGEGKLGSAKKAKVGEDVSKASFKVSLVEPANNNAESK